MADPREEPQTTRSTAPSTDSSGAAPQVQVYDTNRSAASTSDSAYRMTPTDVPAQTGMNWGAVILGILILAVIVALVMWLF